MNLHRAKSLPLAVSLSVSAPLAAHAGPSPFGPAPQTTPGPAQTAPPAVVADPAPSASTEVRDSVTLVEVFDILKRRSPRYKVVQSEIDVAKSERLAARVLPNPILNLAVLYLNQGFNQNGVATYYANVTVPLLIAGQRRMRVRTADSAIRTAEANVVSNYHELAHQARALFVELQAAQEKVEALDVALKDLEGVQTLITAGRRPGVESDYDVVRIAIEISAWKARRAEEEADAQDIAGRLGVLIGVPSWYPRAEGELHQLGVGGDADRLWPEIERTQSGIEAARREEATTVKGIDLARRERWPVPAVTVGTVAIQNYYSLSTFVGLTVALPVFDWGQGLLARANARNQQARLQKEAVVAETQAELQRALRLLEHRRRALETFEKEVLVRLPTLQQMSEDSVRAGQAQLMLDVTRTRLEVKVTHIDMQESTIQAEIDVLAASGRIEEIRPK